MRACEHCGADIAHKRKDARFCNRACKMAHWHKSNRATPEGLASEKVRNKARYAKEAATRKAGARSYYSRFREQQVEYSRRYRIENPDRRRDAHDTRAERIRSNPGYLPFGEAEWVALKRLHRNCCAYCATKSNALEMDHVIPVSRGGRHAIANIVPACPTCNRSKSASLLVEWRYRQRG